MLNAFAMFSFLKGEGLILSHIQQGAYSPIRSLVKARKDNTSEFVKTKFINNCPHEINSSLAVKAWYYKCSKKE